MKIRKSNCSSLVLLLVFSEIMFVYFRSLSIFISQFLLHLFCVLRFYLFLVLTEAAFEVLPRLNEIKFGSGVIDELLFLDLPREYRFPSGMMMLEYAKAIQESVYEQLRVVREGQLRVVFTPDLKVRCK